ncbi:MAG: DUF2628 domain-containing protein [Aquificae bacterium]|nr:DUF2628 domain-containing protein [Aquificota bacterium]
MDNWELYRIFVGKNWQYYLDRFKRFEEGGSVSWNWSAFLFGVLWMFYRKMYLYGVLGFLATVFLNVLAVSLFPDNPLLLVGLQVWLWIGFGAFGNYIYYIFVKEKVAGIKEALTSRENLEVVLAEEGGTSTTAVFLFLAVLFLVEFLIRIN